MFKSNFLKVFIQTSSVLYNIRYMLHMEEITLVWKTRKSWLKEISDFLKVSVNREPGCSSWSLRTLSATSPPGRFPTHFTLFPLSIFSSTFLMHSTPSLHFNACLDNSLNPYHWGTKIALSQYSWMYPSSKTVEDGSLQFLPIKPQPLHWFVLLLQGSHNTVTD